MAKSTSKKTTKPVATASKTSAQGSSEMPSKSGDLRDADIEKNSPEMSSIPSKQSNNGLEELFVDCIKDIYWAENHLLKALPKMLKAAGTKPLQKAFADHLEITKGHVTRLEEIFELLGTKKQAKKCDAMEGLSMEGEGIIEDTEEGTTAREVGLILAAQKVEHYEMATYAGLSKLAKALGKDEIATILSQTLVEEQESDALLASIAETKIDYSDAAASA